MSAHHKGKLRATKRVLEPEGERPKPDIKKIGLISRNLAKTDEFANSFKEAIKILDDQGCDTVVVASWSFRNGTDPLADVKPIHIKTVLFEFRKGDNDEAAKDNSYVVASVDGGNWKQYRIQQLFTSQRDADNLQVFVEETLPKRIIGNACVLLCGEINGVTYSRNKATTTDEYKFCCNVGGSNVVLKPGHYRMLRHEIEKKRSYLSAKNRWVISVWNSGHKFGKARTMDGKGPPWSAFYDERSVKVDPIETALPLTIGIVDLVANRPRKP